MATKKRHFDPVDAKELLNALETARRACIQACQEAPIRGEVYLAAEKVMNAIDEAALVLTGSREHFWLKAQTFSGSSRGTPTEPNMDE